MLTIATNWTTVSSLATGVGTLVLAIATFASVRSANRSARIAEEALVEQRRPVLAQSRFDDPPQKIMFVERNWLVASGGRAAVQHVNGRVYLVMSLRNVGAGIGVCQAWAVSAMELNAASDHLPESDFRAQTRDLYIPAGDLGMWQGAMRDPDEPAYDDVADAIDALEPILVELMYSDQVGEQRTITRFSLVPYTNQDSGEVIWTVIVVRHWFLDRDGPRSERDIQARADQIFRRIQGIGEGPAAVQDRGGAEGNASAEAEGVVEVEATGTQARETDRAETDGERGETNGAEPRQSDQATPAQVDGARPIAAIPRPNCE